MFDRLGAFIIRHWIFVLLGWAALTVFIHYKGPRWDDVTHDGDFAYLPSSMQSVQADRLLKEAFPNCESQSQIIMVVARRDGPLRSIDFDIADRLAEIFSHKRQSDDSIAEVLTYDEPVVGRMLISDAGPNGQTVLVVVRLRTEFMAVDNQRLVRQIVETMQSLQSRDDFPEDLKLGVTGSAAIGSDMQSAIDESIRNTEISTILLVVFILLVVYRAPVLVIVPIITIIVSLMVALGVVAILAQICDQSAWIDYRIFKTTRIFVVVILWGAGTDFCLFLISRYRERLDHGQTPAAALAQTLGRVGSTVTASAMTTILGLGMMLFCAFGKYHSSGPTIAMCLAVVLAASLTLAPALLRAAGWIVFWPFSSRLYLRNRPSGRGEPADASPHRTPAADSTMSGF
ncbi:MAG: MMPL family transporter [Thermoguttaceae bacterium]|jgi:RND superfamily putative drug exporter